jgi:transcriptional regulator with XRE-family HTH domain
MPQEPSIGHRVQAIRKRRGLTQQELATAAGLSVSLIRKLEQDLITDVRMETARKIAAALRVHTTALMTGPDAAPPEDTDAAQWQAVRRALEGRHAAQPDAAATHDGLTESFRAAMPLLMASRYADLRAVLPGLLRDADALVAASDGPEETDARDLRSQIRRVTAQLMAQTWQFDAATDAIQLAIDDASDPVTTITAIDEQCWGLIRAGRLAETRDLAARWADDIEPRISRATKEELACWGMLLLRVSTAAVRDNRPGEAREAAQLARAAAVAADRPDYPMPYNQMFGPATVAIIQAENAIIENRPDHTLAIARQIENRVLPLPRYHHRHRLDVASAHVAKRQHAEAAEVLAEVHRKAPEWLAQQRYARDIVTRMIGHRRTLTPEMRELAAAVRLPL